MYRLASVFSLLSAIGLSQVPSGDSELIRYGSQFGQTAMIVVGCFFIFRQWITTRIETTRKREEAEIAIMQRKADADVATLQAESASRIRVAEGLANRIDRQTDALDRLTGWLQTHEQKDTERDGDMRAHVTAENRRTQAAFRAMLQSVSGREVSPPDETPVRPTPAGIRPRHATPIETPALDPKRRPRGEGP